LIGFDLLWLDKASEVGDTPCCGCGDQNGRNNKSQADHFFAFMTVYRSYGISGPDEE
jgi:hypothetical protein